MTATAADVLSGGGGESGALVRAMDWSQTPLGPTRDWPQSLRTALTLCMSARFPMTLYWGPEFLMLYNDDLLSMIGAKHPWAMGRPAFEVLPELSRVIEPSLRKAVENGEAIAAEDLILPLPQGAAPDEGYFTVTCSPVSDESGGVSGVLCSILDTTEKVIAGRQLRLLNALTVAAEAKSLADACSLVVAQLTLAANDVPFALIYLADEATGMARLAASANMEPGHALAPGSIALDAAGIWPFDASAARSPPRFVPLRDALGEARGAVILPVERSGGGLPLGFVVAGTGAVLRSSESHAGFHNLLGASISHALSNAAAHEREEKRRATSTRAGNERSNHDFLAGGGEMGKLIRSMDWSGTPLGAVETWPQSLRTTVSLCVASNFPISIAWGPQHIQIYNDGYWPICGGKHPTAMGEDFTECWASAWPVIGDAFERALAGETQYLENQRMFLDRNGYLEETFFTFSFSPIRDETGGIGGLFHPVTETTSKMLSERRTRTLRDLAARTAKAKTMDEAFLLAAQAIGEGDLDVPFLLFYAIDGQGRRARLAARAGVPAESEAAAALIELSDAHAVWPIAEVARSGTAIELRDAAARLATTRSGPYPELPNGALVVPLTLPGGERPTAVLVLGVSSRLPLTDVYRAFYDLVTSAVTAAVANARAYEEERTRAEALAQIDRAKTAFFSNVSHEFRTPLTLILGPVEDALAGDRKVLQGESLELVRRNALRLQKMVNTLLDFSRMEAGRAQATFAPTDLSRLTSHLASAFHSAVESAGLKLVIDCPPLAETIYVDPEMWEKIVLNLLSNAVKYTYEGEIRVELRQDHEQAVLAVRDTGVGIPADEVSRVFERFYRARVTQGRSHEGTGIGLALVQELVKLHGGSVAVQSEAGAGTTFTVRIPRGSAHLPPERLERARPAQPSTSAVAAFAEEARRWSIGSDRPEKPNADLVDDAPSFHLPPELAASKILLVDDNVDLRSYVAGLLARMFSNVRTATNGLDALEKVRTELPDLVLSDVMMPGLDGFGLVQALRADERTRAVPIILLSARAGDESTVEGLASGADDYLVKPFSARELVARVRTQLEMVRVRREVIRHQISEDELRRTLKARDEWITVVSHELKTPLSALALSIESLLRNLASRAGPEPSSGDRSARVQAVERHLERMTRQIEQLVDVAELISGRLELARSEVDLSALVRDVVDDARDEAARAGCVLELGANPPVSGSYDRRRLRQMIEILLHNAFKFGAGKPVEVAVSTALGHTAIGVVDHGTGIASEDQERVFSRFERAAPTLNFGGFGLGLWVAQRIAEAHEGGIQLSETSGGGATLTVLLPMNGGSE